MTTARRPRAPRVSPDERVLNELHHGNTMEVSMGKLAQERASDAKVKSFGEKMVKEHGDLDKRLTEFAREHKLAVTDSLGRRVAGHELHEETATQQKLREYEGARFDHFYMTTMLGDHDKDIQKVQTALQKANDKDMKKLLDHTLSVMKDHRKVADEWLKDNARSARTPHSTR